MKSKTIYQWSKQASARPLFKLALISLLIAIFLTLVLIPLESATQLIISGSILFIMWFAMSASEAKHNQWLRIIVLMLGAYISFRYLAWRGIYTLNTVEIVAFFLALMLYLAEIYSTLIHLLGGLVNVSPLKRPLLSLKDLPQNTVLPTVDVMVPSYNEDASLLEVTLRAALQMDYPKNKLAVHLLDDGGTDQKIHQKNRKLANKALERRHTLQALCKKLGVTYHTRPKNEHAKAGNINHALPNTHGDLVLILDADHIPTVDFLDRTVPWMIKDDKIFLVQTPHFMVNPDPIDRNLLRSFRRMPSENDMFYQTIQRGLDFWDASFFCGSAAVLRRKHLDEVGGVSGDSITEDAETAFQLHSKGYKSVYVDQPMVAGLAPETFSGFIVQRMRWAQGMIQILLLKRPFMSKGLAWHQRLGYMSTILFWLFPFARTIFLLSPLAYLIFGAQIYNASLGQVIAYTLPHLIATYMVSSMLFGRTRWPLISEIYELMQSIFSFIAIVKVFINPRKPSFVVTPKGDTLDNDFVSPLYKPFYVLFFLMILGFVFGGMRLVEDPLSTDMTIIVMAWNLFNFITVFAALGALFERQQVRESPRIPVTEHGFIGINTGKEFECQIDDLSSRGCRLICQQNIPVKTNQTVSFHAHIHSLDKELEVQAVVRSVLSTDNQHVIGIEFLPQTETEQNNLVAFAYGDSLRWMFFQNRRSRPMPFMRGFKIVFSLIWYPVILHFRYLSKKLTVLFKPASSLQRSN